MPALIAWAGGALFTAKMLINPFVAAKNTWEIAEHGFARRLPVELTMANDLPVRLAQPLRAHIPYGHDPDVLLYFLDQHAFPPEPPGMWVSGDGRADIIVRSDNLLDPSVRRDRRNRRSPRPRSRPAPGRRRFRSCPGNR